MNTRERVLKEALNCVNGEREKQYGNPEDNFRRIADLWSVYLTSLFEDEKIVVDIDPIDVAKMMILFKIARSNGDKDKMDNYVDIIGYAACAAEIFEKSVDSESKMAESRSCSKKASDNIRDFFEQVAPGTVTNKEEFEKLCNCEECDDLHSKLKPAYVMFDCNAKLSSEDRHEISKVVDDMVAKALGKKDPYSYYHDKLLHYVSIKHKEKHIPLEIDKLKEYNCNFPRELADYLHDAVDDCVINGKKLIDCYKEIDELFKKYVESSPYRVKKTVDKKDSSSLLDIYNSISADILSFSKSANVDPFDIIGRLTIKGHAPTVMAELVLAGKLNLDSVVHYIEDAIHEAKENKK